MTDLTRKEAFIWIEEAQKTFDKLKQIMSSCPVLAIPDFSLPFVVEYDASREGIGAFLTQRGHPIAFESRKLNQSKKGYSIYDKEMLVIMHALHKFRQYLVCGRFVVKIDHNSLKFFLNQSNLNDHQKKWVRKLQAYYFDIEYMKGKNNVVVDALSRKPTLCSLTSISTDWNVFTISEYAKDSFSTKILDKLVDDNMYKFVDELIYYKNMIFLVLG